MSCWTYVAAVVRVDGIQKIDFEKVFGKELHFDSDTEMWDDAEKYPENYLPFGSEGSLSMSVWENPLENHLAKYTVSIFGDLRDHFDYESIINWFKKKVENVWVRQAVITVDIGTEASYTWTLGDTEMVKG